MTPCEVLDACQKAGVSLQINARGSFVCNGGRNSVNRLLPEIRQHKAELLHLLGFEEEPSCALNGLPALSDKTTNDVKPVEAERLEITSAGGRGTAGGIKKTKGRDREPNLKKQSHLSAVSRREKVSDSKLRNPYCAALAKDYRRPLVWIERALKACEVAGVSPDYFVQRHLEDDKSIPLDEGADQAFRLMFLRRSRIKQRVLKLPGASSLDTQIV